MAHAMPCVGQGTCWPQDLKFPSCKPNAKCADIARSISIVSRTSVVMECVIICMDSLRVVNVTVLEISKTTLHSFMFILLLTLQDIENPARVEPSLTRPSHEAFFMACFFGKRSLTPPALDSVSFVWGASGIKATASRREQQRCTNTSTCEIRDQALPCSKPPNQASQ